MNLKRAVGSGRDVASAFAFVSHYVLSEFGSTHRPPESERFRAYGYDELIARDKVNLDITWLKDPSAADLDDGIPPEVIAQEIVDDLTAALVEFSAVADALAARAAGTAGAG